MAGVYDGEWVRRSPGMNLDFDEIKMLWVDTYMKLLRGGNLAVAKSTA